MRMQKQGEGKQVDISDLVEDYERDRQALQAFLRSRKEGKKMNGGNGQKGGLEPTSGDEKSEPTEGAQQPEVLQVELDDQKPTIEKAIRFSVAAAYFGWVLWILTMAVPIVSIIAARCIKGRKEEFERHAYTGLVWSLLVLVLSTLVGSLVASVGNAHINQMEEKVRLGWGALQLVLGWLGWCGVALVSVIFALRAYHGRPVRIVLVSQFAEFLRSLVNEAIRH
jgi:hypothetical protein